MALWDDLKGYWPFNGNLMDYLGLLNGTIGGAGTLAYVSSMTGFDECMDLTPSKYVTIGPVTWGSASFSISCWFNSDVATSGAYYTILGQSDGSALGFNIFTDTARGGRIRFEIGTDGVNWRSIWSTNAPSTSTWYHLVVVVDRSTNSSQMYIDGVLQSYASDTGAAAGSLSVVGTIATKLNYWCAADVVGWNQWDGKIDDCAIWGRALSAAEALQIYNVGNGGRPLSELIPRRQFPDNGEATSWIDMAGNVGLWHLNGNANDTSGQGNNGTPSGTILDTVGMTLYSGSVEFTGSMNIRGGGATSNVINMAAGADLLPGTTNNISISLWQYGDAGQPIADTVIEGIRADSNRSFMIHLPFSNGRVYWDAGDNPTYDRIDKLATAAEYEGGWHHWVFTKDATAGTMAIYLDGALWHSGTGKTTTLSAITDFWIGNRAALDYSYAGSLDEIAIWSRTINSDEVLSIYNAQKFLFLGTGSQTAINLYGSAVHSGPQIAVAENLFGTVVHDGPQTAAGINLFSSIVHEPVQISGTVADITGTVGIPATFDGTPVGASTSSANYQWSWQSVPGGSSIANSAFPLPDSKAITPVNMSGNVGLWHFEASASITPFPDGGAATPIDMTDNLGLWHFETTGVTTPDTSGGGRDLTVNGATQVPGKVGSYALEFDGTNDYLSYAAADVFPGTTNAISIAFWQYGGVGLGNNSIIRANTGANRVINIHMHSSGQIYFDCGNSLGYDRINKTAPTLSGMWNHWVFLKDVAAGEMKIYLNGALWHSGSGMTKALTAIDQLYIGSESAAALFYKGKIDEIAVWSRVLSAAEIKDIFNKQFGGFEDGSGEENGLVKVGDPTLTTGKVGTYAVDFNGTTDGLVSDLSNPPTTDGTIAGWVNLDETNNDKLIFGLGPPAIGSGTWRTLFVDNSGILRFTGYSADSTTTTTLSTGIWYHLAVTWENVDASNDDVIIYVDGAKIHSQTLNLNTPQTTFNIAYRGDTWGPYWTNMAADEVATWNRALSALEINQLFFFNSGSCASGSVGLGETFTFTPDVSGTYVVQLGLDDGVSSLSGYANAFIDDAPTPPPSASVITASNPTVDLVSADSLGYIFNTYKIELLSVQRSRTTMEVPFKLGTKGKQSLRVRTNEEFTGSA